MANLGAFSRGTGIKGWSKLALRMSPIRDGERFTCGASIFCGSEIERHPGIGILPRFIVIDVELLYMEVLARVALPCDSGQSDLPN